MRTSTEFFGFYQDPFKRTPDVDFYYPTKMHIEALDTLLYLIHSDEPFAVLTGEPGTGKTITIKKFINELPENIVSAYILFPNLTPEELFMAILEDFDIHVDKTLTKNALFAKLRDFLIEIGSKGKKAVIIIDEAQNLPNETLEELRLLSNLETEKDKLLKIILAGQPELDAKLNDEGLRQLKQRVTLYVRLYNIKDEDIKDYIYSHLEKAGKGYISIHNDVIRKIAKITRGNPRLINTLMDRTIIAAFLDESHTITDEHLRNAISSINHVIEAGRKPKHVKAKPLIIVAVIGILAVLVGYLGVDKILDSIKSDKQVYVADNTQENDIQQPVSQPEVKEDTTAINNVDNRQETAQYEDNSASTQAVNENMQSGQNNTQAVQEEQPLQQAEAEQPVEVQQNIPEPVEEKPAVNNEPEVEVIQQPVVQAKDVYILAKSLNIRSTPSLEAVRVGAAKMGQKFEYVQENKDWVEIRLSPTMTGWVFKRYVSISNR